MVQTWYNLIFTLEQKDCGIFLGVCVCVFLFNQLRHVQCFVCMAVAPLCRHAVYIAVPRLTSNLEF